MDIWLCGTYLPLTLPDVEEERFEREYSAFLRSGNAYAEFAYIEGATHHYLRLDSIVRRQQREEYPLQAAFNNEQESLLPAPYEHMALERQELPSLPAYPGDLTLTP